MTDIDLTPDPEEIVQGEAESFDTIPIAVKICGPVESRELPAIRAGYATETGVGSIAVRLLPFEPRRKSATIVAPDQDIWISNSQAGAQMGAAASFRVPAATLFEITHLDAVWACAVTDTTDVSVMSTYWSQ